MSIFFRFNILALGKTGVGKSSLLNYLFGTNLKTGLGKAITPKGFFQIDTEINGCPIRVFDSWGIEVNKLDEGNKLLETERKKHGIVKNPEDWFHSVVYCIQANGSRVESCDIQIISDFLNFGYKVVVAFTKSDIAGKEDDENLKKSILDSLAENKENISIVPVCSIEHQARNGMRIEPFGRNELIGEFFSSWDKSLKNRAIMVIERNLCSDFDDFCSNLTNAISAWDKSEDELLEYVKSKIFLKSQEVMNFPISQILQEFVTRYSDLQISSENTRRIKVELNLTEFTKSRFFESREKYKSRLKALVCGINSNFQYSFHKRIVPSQQNEINQITNPNNIRRKQNYGK